MLARVRPLIAGLVAFATTGAAILDYQAFARLPLPL